jgi:hypothetical protein
MYCLLELLTLVGVVVALALILFAVGAAFILVDEGMRSVLGLSTRFLRQIVAFSTTSQKGWKAPVSD